MEETAVLYQRPGSSCKNIYFFRNFEQRDIFLQSPELFTDELIFPSPNDIPEMIAPHNAAQLVTKEKNLANYCPVSLYEEEKIIKGYQLYLVTRNNFSLENKFIFETPQKMMRFLANPVRYSKVSLPVKMPPITEKISLLSFSELEDSVPFLEQSIGAIATRGLLEITSCRLKYPTLSVKETALKLFAMFLKANNPSNSEYMRKKSMSKMKMFVERCNLPNKIYKLKLKIDKIAEKEEKSGDASSNE